MESEWVQVPGGRDSFARHSLVRRQVAPGKVRPWKSCNWCGSLNKWGKLFQYGIDPDVGKINEIKGVFCSKDCMETYHT